MHDAAYKRLFSHPRMVEDLLRGFIAANWTGALDFETLEKLPAEFVSDDLRQRRGDGMWRVRFRDEWLYVLVLLEFQSTVDPYMAVRILVYTGLLHQDLVRRSALGPDGELPPVLPVVIYNGRSRWTAETDVSRLIAPVGEDLARCQPSQRYFVVDAGGFRDDDLPQRNLVSAVVRLENSRSRADLKRVVDALVEWLRGPGHRDLKRSFGEWIGQVLMPRRLGSVSLPRVPELEEVQTMLAERVQEWYDEAHEKGLKAGMAKGVEQGIQQGIARGIAQGIERVRGEERALLCRLAARKFDAETAERLSELLDGLTATDRLAEIGECIIDCNTGADLLERTHRMTRRN